MAAKKKDELKKIKPKIIKILKANGIKKAGIFGSYAKCNHKKKSDGKISLLLRCYQLIECVHYLHSCNFVHGNLKASNIILPANNYKGIRILDAGVSRILLRDQDFFQKHEKDRFLMDLLKYMITKKFRGHEA